MMQSHRYGACRFAALAVLLAAPLTTRLAQAELPYEEPPINYLTAEDDNPVSQLARRLEQGELRLEPRPPWGPLPALLEALEIPVSSQGLVFSQTSFQRNRISRRTPRAIYFGDEVYVGYVPGGEVLEISTADPRLGGTFYTLDARPDQPARLSRRTHDCLQCHVSNRTADLPGHLIRSLYVDRQGMPIFNLGTLTVDHTTPLERRWGGWYVSGTHGGQVHLGNQTFVAGEPPGADQLQAGANRTDLSSLFDTSLYLSPHSDLVALMVLEHQTQMHNRIARASYEERMAAHYDDSLNQALGRPAGERSESYHRRCQQAVEQLLEVALFSGEASLTEPVRGTSDFQTEFSARSPRDARGRSLYQLDLEHRLFRYPLSYLVYSRAMRELPEPVAHRFYSRLAEVLRGQDTSSAFAHLTAGDRAALDEILRATGERLGPSGQAIFH